MAPSGAFFIMRRLFLALLLCSTPAMAQVAGEFDTDQQNDNSAIAQPVNTQQNQSRSESIGGSLINNQFNTTPGELGEFGIGDAGVQCQSATFYTQVGVVPQDNVGFYTFEDRNRDMMYTPQASLGVQMPFGPQVAACIEAMKNKAQQIMIATEAGTLEKCLKVKEMATRVRLDPMELSEEYPVLCKKCSKVWAKVQAATFD